MPSENLLPTPAARVPVVDLHNDLLTAVQHQTERELETTFEDFWLPQLEAGGVDLQVLPFFTDEPFVGEGALRRCLLAIDLAHQLVARHADRVHLVLTRADVERCARNPVAPPTGLLLALEGLEPVGKDLGLLRVLHGLGVRMASLTWNRRTMFGDGQAQGPQARLTHLGVEAVAEMEQIGMVVDVSHLNEGGFWHVEEVATRPYLASHSSCRALWDHARNLTDDQLRAVGARGGVVGINVWGRFLGPEPGVEAVLDHVEHALSVAGEHAVALGPDFMYDYTQVTSPVIGRSATEDLDRLAPEDLRRPEVLPALVARLTERVGEELAARVCHGNALRVLADLLPADAAVAVPAAAGQGGAV